MDGTGQHLIGGISGGNIYFSSDFGASYSQSNAPNRLWISIALSKYGPYSYAVEQSYGNIYYSTTYGSAWTVVNNFNISVATQIVTDSTGQYVYAVGRSDTRFYYSLNNGVSWSVYSSSSCTRYGYFTLAVDGTGRHIFVAEAVAGGSKLYRFQLSSSSTISLVTSKALPTTVFSLTSSILPIVNSTFHLVLAGYYGPVYYSAKSGSSFTQSQGAPYASWRTIASSANGTYVTVGGNAGVYCSSNFGATFTVTSLQATNLVWSSIAVSSSGRLQAVVASGSIFYYSSNFASSWAATHYNSSQ